jgi:diguanylate cyclase (GGDEF)-like protein
LLQFAEKALAVGHIYHGEWQMQRADGQQFWAVLRAQRTHPGDPSLGVIWTVMDHSEQVAARRQLEWNARHDALTRLANRSELERRVAQCLSKGAASQPSALVAIDLDRFKSVNDTAGHAAGDAMLQAVAEALRSCIRAADVAVRLGGDEFVLLLEHCPAQDALRIARAACAAIERIDLCWEGHRLHVGASAGVAMLEPGMPQAVHWLRAADQACYAAKRHGRGHVRLAGASAHAAQG